MFSVLTLVQMHFWVLPSHWILATSTSYITSIWTGCFFWPSAFPSCELKCSLVQFPLPAPQLNDSGASNFSSQNIPQLLRCLFSVLCPSCMCEGSDVCVHLGPRTGDWQHFWECDSSGPWLVSWLQISILAEQYPLHASLPAVPAACFSTAPQANPSKQPLLYPGCLLSI